MSDLSMPVLAEWRQTKDTLHLWAQIMGKTKLALTPMRNHWWNVTLFPTPRGLSTGRMPHRTGDLEIELNIIDARLDVRTSAARESFDLEDGLSVASFYDRYLRVMDRVGVEFDIDPTPFGVPMETPFKEDEEHASFDQPAAMAFLRVLQWSSDVLEEFAGWYTGKTSPVHLFWHSFDLALARFSGQPAEVPEGTDRVTAEAYSHEVIAFGFWPGDDETPHPSYYSYTAPEPEGLREEPLRPPEAKWVEQGDGSNARLALSEVRRSAEPKSELLGFFQSAYEAGASLQGWALFDTTSEWCPVPRERLRRLAARTRTGP